MNAAARQDLIRAVSGCVLYDEEILRYYSVDASSYQIVPDAVVVPSTETDVAQVVRFAKKHKTSVTARGAGTGLVGNSLNRGIILDMKNFDSISVGRDSVVVGSGTRKGILDDILKKYDKFFPPNPSVGRYCSIGGMLGNNSSGSRSLKYGSTIDNVLEVRFIDGNGNIHSLPQDLILGRKILNLAEKVDRGMIPRVSKNSSGYRLEQVSGISGTQRIIAGSEGTLGIIVSARLRIRSVPKSRVLYILEYDSPLAAANDCHGILRTGPSAIEFVDAQTLVRTRPGFCRGASCFLFVEYDSTVYDAGARMRRAASGTVRRRLTSERGIRNWWQSRDMSLHYSIKSINPHDRMPHIIEDAVVPVENLPGLFDAIHDLNQKFNTSTITYGHAGNGNMHVRLLADRRDPARIRRMSAYYFDRVLKLGGSVSGEHGDGLARTELVRMQYGEKNFKLFRQLKRLFDPHNILNPGKKISQKSTMVQNLETLARA